MTAFRLVPALAFAAAVFAQTSATIRGTVRDATGGVLSGVDVRATHAGTAFSRSATTNEDGAFTIAALPVGRYEMRAEKQTFRPTVNRDILLEVGETAVFDLVLEVGAVDQEITVRASAPPVNVSSSELSYLVSEQAIEELPLNGRNYTDLVFLQPGAIAYPHRDGGSVVAHGMGASINGQDPRSNMYLLDGTPMNDFTNGPAGSAASTALGMETVREFRVETNAYSAEFGRTSGGQISVITKSGSNDLHGSVYEFHRNDNFDARNFFDPSRPPEFKRNQFGATAGGPIRKDRSFFFAGWEALREVEGRTITTIVPDVDARRGIIGGQTYTVSPLVRPYLDEFPLPNGLSRGGGQAEYRFAFNRRLVQDFAQARYDRNLGSSSQFFARYTYDGARNRLPTDYPQFPRSFVSRNQFVTTELRSALSPATLNTARLGLSRTRIGQEVESNTTQQLQPFVPGRSMPGNIDIAGFPRFGPQTSVDVRLVQNVYSFEDGITHQAGKHLLKAGGLIERYQNNMVNPTFGLGVYTFDNLPLFLQARPSRFLGLTPSGALDRYWRWTLFGVYLQDDVKLHRRLTLNIGVRYETTTTPKDLYGRDSALPNLLDRTPTTGQNYLNPTRRNISPRIGFAWDLFGDASTSLRAGYGWFFNTNNHQNLIVTVTNPPATPRPIVVNPSFPVPAFERGSISIRPIEWNLRNPNVHMWNANIQRQLWRDTVVTVGYAGSRGVHLLRSTDINLPAPERLADGTLFFRAGAPRPNTAFTTIELKKSDGNSWYNAMIVELRKRFSAGLSFQSSYTFSRNIDTTQASTFFSDATNGTTTAMPEYPGFNYNKGLADYHAKHNWVFNATYELPFGRGLTGLAKALGAGWEMAAIAQMRSGNPLTVFVQRNRSRSQWSPSLGPGIGFDRPSMAPGRTHESAVLGGPDRYFDPSAFVLQPAGTLGNLGRGTFTGPDLKTVDLSLMKHFPLRERANLEFRAEAFNLFNHANFSNPGLTVFPGVADVEAPLGSFGRIRSTVTSSRQIQLGLRLAF